MARKWSQSTLARVSGISLPAIKNLERAHTDCRKRTLVAVATALGVELRALQEPIDKLQAVRMRSTRKMKSRENILSIIGHWLEDYTVLERLLQTNEGSRFITLKNICVKQEVSHVAALCRGFIGLGANESIGDISSVFALAGIKLLLLPVAAQGFYGLSVSEYDGGPAIVVNTWGRITVERQIFSAFVQFGHLLLHPNSYDVLKTMEEPEEDERAQRFVREFLIPEEDLNAKWRESSGLHWIERVFKLKRLYRVGCTTMLIRLVELELLKESHKEDFVQTYRQRYSLGELAKDTAAVLDGHEPFRLSRFDFFEERFARLVHEGLEKKCLGVHQACSMLRISETELQQRLSD
jgi:Zn-dependent peptidase ImmA (M78 family)/transcriptional regulator with XRE-family HTH domain